MMFSDQLVPLSRLCEPWQVHLSILQHVCLMCPRQFDRLKPVSAAAYDTARRQSCFGDTRAQLLSEVRSWMNDCGGKSIYILYGVAGIGKSTVATTVAEH